MNRIERRRRETRRKILDAALDLFSLKGLGQTTIADITERADIGKGSFYEHFEAKDDLIRHLLRDGYDDLLGIIESKISTLEDLQSRAAEVLRVQWVHSTRDRRFFRFIHQVRGLLKLKVVGEERDLIGLEFRRFVNRLIDILLAPADRDRPEKRQEMVVVACALAGTVSGYLSYRMVLEGDVPGEEELRILQDVLIPGLLKGKLRGKIVGVREKRIAS